MTLLSTLYTSAPAAEVLIPTLEVSACHSHSDPGAVGNGHTEAVQWQQGRCHSQPDDIAHNTEPPMILQTKSLFISAGHSHSDPGAVGNGHTEADIVLAFRDAVADELEGKVVFDRDGQRGQNLPLRKAVQQASSHDVAVEFHTNAGPPSASGVETLSHPDDYPLGQALCEAISDTLGIANRGAKGEASGQHSRLAFVSTGGGIIVELFFISNPDDVAAYYRHKRALAQAVARVLIDEVAPPREEFF